MDINYKRGFIMRKRTMEKLRKISTMYYLRRIAACFLVYCVFFVIPAQVALANPAPDPGAHPSTELGGYIATPGGSAITAGAITNITAPHGSIFDWKNFDIGFGHTVEHPTQGVTDAVLHRVNVTFGYGDGAATGIFGNLNAPGNLFVVNPMGIVIGADAMIAAQRFVASGLNISDDDFRNLVFFGTIDELRFEGYAPGTLGVELKAGGQITAETVGLIGARGRRRAHDAHSATAPTTNRIVLNPRVLNIGLAPFQMPSLQPVLLPAGFNSSPFPVHSIDLSAS